MFDYPTAGAIAGLLLERTSATAVSPKVEGEEPGEEEDGDGESFTSSSYDSASEEEEEDPSAALASLAHGRGPTPRRRVPLVKAAPAPTLGILSCAFRLPGSSSGSAYCLLHPAASLSSTPDASGTVPLQRWDPSGPLAAAVSAGSGLPSVCLGSFLPSGPPSGSGCGSGRCARLEYTLPGLHAPLDQRESLP